MPNPRPVRVSATVTSEDVRRAFYATPLGAGWDAWIEEMQLDPLQLIVCDDTNGGRRRVPVIIGAGEGEAAVSFGDPVEVRIRYEDQSAKAAAAAVKEPLRFASRAESRPGQPRPPRPTSRISPAAAAARIHNAKLRGAAGMPLDPAKIREALGLPAGATDEEVRTALAGAGLASSTPPPTAVEPTPAPTAAASAPTEPPPAPRPAGQPPAAPDVVVLDPELYAALRLKAERGDDAWRQLREARNAGVLDAAMKAGKIPPARRQYWELYMASDPDGAIEQIEKLQPNVMPVAASGYTGGSDGSESDLVYAAMYPDNADKRGVGSRG